MNPLARVMSKRSVLAAALAAWATTAMSADITVWHTLQGNAGKKFNELVTQFNKQQADVKIIAEGFDSPASLKDKLTTAIAAKKQPTFVQWSGGDLTTLNTLEPGALANAESVLAGNRDVQSLTPAAAAPFRDSNGKLAALPLTPSIPVLVYRTDVLDKAGVESTASLRTWRDLQAVLLKVRNAGATCSMASPNAAWVHVENLAPWHNQPYYTKGDGAQGPGQAVFNDILHVRHLALMISWNASNLLRIKDSDKPLESWVSGECPVAVGPSTLLADAARTPSARIGVAPLPLWDEVSVAQGGLFPLGDGWVPLSLKTNDEKNAAKKFAAWWLSPVTAAEWNEHSGSIPFSEASFLANKRAGNFDRFVGWEGLAARTTAASGNVARPLKLSHRDQVLKTVDLELQKAFTTGKAAKAVLDDAVVELNRLPAHAEPAAKTAKGKKK